MRRRSEPREQKGDHREACDCEERGDGPQALEAEIEVGDGPCDQEVQRRAAALLEHDLEDLVERMPPDEERQGLVLVRRPGEQLVEEEGGGREP